MLLDFYNFSYIIGLYELEKEYKLCQNNVKYVVKNQLKQQN